MGKIEMDDLSRAEMKALESRETLPLYDWEFFDPLAEWEPDEEEFD